MKIKHDCPQGSHEVWLCDDGTLDTVLNIDGVIVRYANADRDEDGRIILTSRWGTCRSSWLEETAREACDAGDLLTEDDHG